MTLSIASGPPGATLEGILTVMAVDGRAYFNVIFNKGDLYSLAASSGALSGQSVQFTVS